MDDLRNPLDLPSKTNSSLVARLKGLGDIDRRTGIVVVSLTMFAAAVWFGLAGELSVHARLAFIILGFAVAGWVFTKVNGTYIALAAAISFTVVGIDEPDEFFEALGDSTIWLLLAAFIIAAGIAAVGLSDRLTTALIGRAKTVRQLFYLVTAALIATALAIPATSGRAALMIPVFVALSASINDKRITKALALLFPTIILLSAVASLIGAGAHLVTVEILWKMGGEQIGFAQWLLLGLPFAVVSCFASAFVISSVFLTSEERSRKLSNDSAQNSRGPLSRQEKTVIVLVALLVLMWVTQPLHGINNTLVAVLGALLMTAPKIGAVDYKASLKSVNWNLLLFMAATLELGEALIESKAAEWLVTKMFGALEGGWTSSSVVVITAVTLVSLLSHLFITSRTARSSVLIPLVVLLAVSLGYNPTSLAFLATAAAGYCLTLPVSAKPVSMFGQIAGVETYQPSDLLRLSKYLLPLHFFLLVLFAFVVWPQMGLTTQHQRLETPPQAPIWYRDIPADADGIILGGVLPETAPTPWAVFGDYSDERNRQRLIRIEPAPVATPTAPMPQASPSPTPTIQPTPTRQKRPVRSHPRRRVVSDDDDDN